jgi:hypothetical protein
MLTVAALSISTRTFSPKPVGSSASVVGAWMIAPAPLPWMVRLLSIVTCSKYAPGSTRMVSPEATMDELIAP